MTEYQQTRWSLKDLMEDTSPAALQAAFDALVEKAAAFEAARPRLRDDLPVDEFLEILGQLEEMTLFGNRVMYAVQLKFAEDTQEQSSQLMVARSSQLAAELANRTLFFSLWWKALSDEAAERYLQAAGDRRYWLEQVRHFKPYTLSEAEEKVINLKDATGASTLNLLYDSITNRYTFRLKVDGKVKRLTRGELMVHARSADADLRARAYREVYRVYGKDGDILGQIYQALARDWHNENIGLRGYSTPLSVRNLVNDLPDGVVDTLLDTCRQNRHVFQRFFRLKARLLGMERLRRCDLYAPVSRAEKAFPFENAARLVLDSFRGFDPGIAGLAERVFAHNHLDGEVRRGKQGGAFCASPDPALTPWVLLNYQGRAEDVATMAHELGHAVHSLLAAGHSVFTYEACLPLAETASTFGEMLLVDRLLKEESDPAVRRDLIFRQVDDAYATILRQAYFALFERQAHAMTRQGAGVGDLCQAYLENLGDQFGTAVEVSPEFRWEWVSIPHIYGVPFYVYAYSFGQLLVLALYEQYRVEGEAFKPRYLKILSAGGSQAPVQVLEEAGIDPRQAAFWQGGFDVIRRLVEELETL